jgi:hypothetical protein
MEKLIENIKESSILTIHGQNYKPVAKVHYVTSENPDNEYVKVFFEGHFVLVISPDDNYMYFGKDMGCVWKEYPTPDKFSYNGQIYSKVVMDYQLVKFVEFGNPMNSEGEVEFIDYKGKNNSLVSIGKVMRNGKRADVVANIIDLTDIIIIKY